MKPFNVLRMKNPPIVGGSQVVFLSGFEGGSVVDESPLAQTVTLVGATQSSAEAKFGTKSLKITTTDNDIATCPDDPAYFSGADNFTIEGWFRWAGSIVTGQHNLICKTKYDTGDNAANWGWELGLSFDGMAGNLGLTFNDTNYGYFSHVNDTFTPSIDTWYHLATDWDGDKFRIYANGSVVVAKTSDEAFGDPGTTPDIVHSPQPLSIGGLYDDTDVLGSFTGYIDEVRITSGLAQYATDIGFIPPAAPFPR